MQKRTIAILLLVGGALALLAVLYWTFKPWLDEKRNAPPAPVPSAQPNKPSTGNVKTPTSPAAPPARPASVTGEERLQQFLKQQASQVAARQGTYASSDEFAALRELMVEVSPAMQTFLEGQRQALIKAHPAKGPSWGQTTKTLSSRITSSLPIGNQATVEVTVQAQQIIESAGKPPEISYREIIVSYQRLDNRWIVTRIESRLLVL